MSIAKLGKPLSDKHIENLRKPKSAEHIENLRKPKSAEHKRKIGKANKGKTWKLIDGKRVYFNKLIVV